LTNRVLRGEAGTSLGRQIRSLAHDGSLARDAEKSSEKPP